MKIASARGVQITNPLRNEVLKLRQDNFHPNGKFYKNEIFGTGVCLVFTGVCKVMKGSESRERVPKGRKHREDFDSSYWERIWYWSDPGVG